MHPDKLDRAKLMSRVEKYGYSDIAAALRERGGLPDPEQAYLTGGVENVDDFYATAQVCKQAPANRGVDQSGNQLCRTSRGS